MSAPTTEEVREMARAAWADARSDGPYSDNVYAQGSHGGCANALEAHALPIAEERDALAAEVARLRSVNDGARQAWADMSTRCDAAEAEVARLRADIELFQRSASQAEQTRRDLAAEVARLKALAGAVPGGRR